MHTLAAAGVGAALAAVLHKQLAAWASSSAAAVAAKLLAGGGAGTATAGKGHGGPAAEAAAAAAASEDVEALEYASLYQQHHLHHHPQRHHPHTHPLPPPASHPMHLDAFQQQQQRRQQQQRQQQQQQQGHGSANGVAPAGPEEEYLDRGGGMNGYRGSSVSSLHSLPAPYHRGSAVALPGATTPPASGAVTPTGGPHAGAGSPARRWQVLLPAPQLAAGATVLAALAAGAAATGWHLACTLLLLGDNRSAALLPAVLLLVGGQGLAAGALARTLPTRSPRTAGAVAGGALAGLTALVAALVVAQARESAHMAAVVRAHLYPNGGADTAEALAGGALCAAAAFTFGAGAALKPRSTRGGALLGAAAGLLLAGLRYALCSATPYCLSVQLLLQGR